MRKYLLSGICLAALYAPAHSQIVSNGAGGSGCIIANPTATASDTAVNGVATTCMASDSAPAVQKAGSAQFGVVEVDGTTITAAGGVISAVTGAGNAVFGTATGNTANDFVSMSNTTVGVKDSTYSAASFAPAGQVVRVTGSDPTITAAEWAAYVQFTITGTGRTLTFPASSTLSNNGGAQIDTNASSVIVAANAADTITWNGATTGAGGTVTLPVGGLWAMSTDGAGKLYISGKDVTGTGSNVRATSPTLVTPALGTPSALVLTNATGLVASTGTTATGTPSSTTYLRGDNTWSTPAGGGSGCTVSGTAGQAVYNDGSTGCLSSAATFTSGGGLILPANGAASTPSTLISGTPYSAGTATTNFPLLGVITAGSTGPTSWSTAGTMLGINAPSGFTGNLIDMHTNGGGNIFDVSATGASFLAGTLTINATSNLTFSTRSRIGSPSDGVMLIQNNAGTAFTRLQLGGTTSSFPAIARNSAALNFVLADASGDAAITAAGGTFSGVIINTGITTDATHTDATVCEDTTTHQFYFGSGTLGICLGTSTREAKQNIKPLSANALGQILALKPVSFNYRPGWGYDTKKPFLGFIAEDVEPILPQLVGHDAAGKVHSADYVGMIPVLVRAMQEQQREINELWMAVIVLFAGICGLGGLQFKRR